MLLLGTKNTATQTVPVAGFVNLGSVYRRYCKKNSCGIRTFDFDSSSISLNQQGFYKITLTATVSAPAAGDVTLQLLENGTPITGALATETITTATTEFRNIAIDYFILVDKTCILNNLSTLAKSISVQNTGVAATITNIIVDVLKVI